MEEESSKEKGPSKILEHPISAAPAQENNSFNTASLKPKSKPKVCRRGVEKKKKRKGKEKSKVENSHFFWTFISPTVVVNTGSLVLVGGNGWEAAEARRGQT